MLVGKKRRDGMILGRLMDDSWSLDPNPCPSWFRLAKAATQRNLSIWLIKSEFPRISPWQCSEEDMFLLARCRFLLQSVRLESNSLNPIAAGVCQSVGGPLGYFPNFFIFIQQSSSNCIANGEYCNDMKLFYVDTIIYYHLSIVQLMRRVEIFIINLG